MTKTLKDHFCDWELDTFGYGYGAGEEFTIPAVRQFLDMCRKGGHGYSVDFIQDHMDPTVAWFVINTLCGVGIIEYGVSPCNGFLTKQGIALRDYMCAFTDDELIEQVTCRDFENVACLRGHCNCEVFERGPKCHNPFWE